MIYTFDLIDADAQVYDLQIGLFADDAAAKCAATSLLKKHVRASAIDIWDEDRRVMRMPTLSDQHNLATGL